MIYSKLDQAREAGSPRKAAVDANPQGIFLYISYQKWPV